MAAPIVEWETGWRQMQKGYDRLVRILENEGEPGFTSREYMDLYTVAYNMCTQKPPYEYTQQLYQKYVELVKSYIDKKTLPYLNKQHDVFLLKEFEKMWLNNKVLLRWLSRFFNYLERYYIPRQSQPSLKQVCFDCFREKVYKKLQPKVRSVILSLIEREREGEQIERSAVKNLLSMLVDLSDDKDVLKLYRTDFEAFMLKNTDAYYSRKASKHILEDSCANYLLMAEGSLMREKERAAHYLHSSTESQLIEVTQNALLFEHANEILEKDNSGLQFLLQDNRAEDLSRMYRLFSKREKGLEPASVIFKKHIADTGVALVKEVQDAAKNKSAENKGNAGLQEQLFVNRVIELHDKYIYYCDTCFMGDIIFHKALKEGFEIFFNKEINGMSSAEMLSTFCDSCLQKGSALEKLGDDAIEETIGKIVGLLSYLHDRDLFAEFSRKKLARRLLSDKSSNIEHERHMLSKLKQQFGAYFTSKMEGMITDLTLARDVQVEFQNYLKDNKDATLGTDVGVTVLTTGFWPTYKTVDFNPPTEFLSCIETFKDFYTWKSNHRKLTWIFSLGSCTVTGKFDSRPIELQLSTYQAAALLLYNDGADSLSFSDIKKQLRLPNDEITRVLHSLSCGKYKILLREPNNKVIYPTDVFKFNSKFTDKMRRIKVPLPHVEEKKKVIEDVDKDRKFSIDAALVRIMKSRKVLGHQQLVMECVQILSSMFKPDIKIIKRRIEDLIHREYLERDEENANTYKYLA